MRHTSIETYHQIREEGLLSKIRFQVYDVLYQHGPLTQNEVARRIPGAVQHSVSPRFAELESLGVVSASDERMCAVSGRNVLTWRVTGKLPGTIKKKVRRVLFIEMNEFGEIVWHGPGPFPGAVKFRECRK